MGTSCFDKFGPSRAAKSHKKQKRSQNGQRNEPSTSRYHRSARNFATILMAPTVLQVTKLKIQDIRSKTYQTEPQNSEKSLKSQ